MSSLMSKVLIIDDNSGILYVMQQALELKGYVVEILDQFPGIQHVQKNAPNLIYLDVSLLGKDGREVCRELKSAKNTSHIPVIMLTAHTNAAELAVEAKADGYLSKPFELEELWKITAKYCISRPQSATTGKVSS